MVPRTILDGLSHLRRRERLLRLAWGAARWFGLFAGTLAVSCLIDWTIDRFTETPFVIRGVLLFLQLCLWGGAAWFLILLPLVRRLTNSKLALMVEDRYPKLDHRLVSTVELNQPGARTAGMSPQLIAAVTRETEHVAPQLDFPAVADHRRLSWSAFVAGPVLLAIALAFVLFPYTLPVLIARQFLADAEIPRSVYLKNESVEVWRSGEELTLSFKVWGNSAAKDLQGTVYVRSEGGPREEYDLVYDSKLSTDEQLVYSAKVRPMPADVTFSAAMLDGRTHRDGHVKIVPRPAVVRLDSWLVLPEYCGTRPDGSRYEVQQLRGDVTGFPNTSAKVVAHLQKPVFEATLETLTGEKGDKVSRSFSRKFAKDKGAQEVEWTFEMLPNETFYRITVLDEYGFANDPLPVRALALGPEPAPRVALLPERFIPRAEFRLGGRDDEFVVDGLPVPLEANGKPGPLRIAYDAIGLYGLGNARLRYRVVKQAEGSPEGPPKLAAEERWATLSLVEVPQPGKEPFDPKRGLFGDSKKGDEVPFHAIPTRGLPHGVPRSVGGGNFVFETAGIPDGKGGVVPLRPGDQVEFYVEVSNGNPRLGEAVYGRSETRVRTIATDIDFVLWVQAFLEEQQRLGDIQKRQEGVFPLRPK